MQIKSFVSQLGFKGGIPLHTVTLKLDDGNDFWVLMFSSKAKIDELMSNIKSNPTISEYGKIIYSGFGTEPPEYILKRVKEEYQS